MDLVDPTIKMSKSSENQKGVIYLLDEPEVVRKKIMSATTDSDMSIKFDIENKPGISNLINLYAALKNMKIEEVETKFRDNNYGEFKKAVADIVVEFISNIQEEYNKYLNSDIIDNILNKGIEKARKEAKEKYILVKERIGFIR